MYDKLTPFKNTLLTMLTIRDLTLSRGNKVLLKQANATLYDKQKVGLVGQNGCGKSSLFGLILNQLPADTGDCLMSAGLRISHLSQSLPDSQEPALEFVLGGDDEYQHLQQELARAERENNHELMLACHDRLTQTGGYGKPAKAAAIMAGLGFASESQGLLVNHFSGGWRMRLSLARCLMKPADLLLLDEPTNHLDMEAIFWLERWLKQSPSAIILISHDREFLDAFVSHILHIEQQSLTLYTGNYSRFEQTRAEQLALQQMMHEKQQQKIAHMMDYVRRFRAKASKAKQAQSRLNAVAKMEIVAKAQVDSPFSFDFFPCPRAGNPLIQCDQVMAGYDPKHPVLKQLNLSISPGDRIALLGPNGQGKSTFIKTLNGSLKPLDGIIHRSPHLKIGYYAQHQLEALDNRLSPLETIQILSPEVKEQTIRNFLGGFAFVSDMAVNPITHFSGGEKARLALAKLVWQQPNLLLLDEPTNHLDLTMRAAIEIALQSYEGALILISHDRHLLRSAADDYYLVFQQRVQPFAGSLEDYHQWLQSPDTKAPASPAAGNTPYREKKTLQNRLKKLEQLIEQAQSQLISLEAQLADPALYEKENQQALASLHDKQKKHQLALDEAEEEWLDIVQTLEHMV